MTQALKKSLTAGLLAIGAGEHNSYSILTKIICTIGPKTNDVKLLASMIEAGMAVARLNFSHGNFDYFRSVIANVREASALTGHKVAIMLDTKGPEIRTCKLDGGADVELQAGTAFTFTNDTSVVGNASVVATTYKNLPNVVEVGKQILVDDGLIALTVQQIDAAAGKVHCLVENTGMLGENKGVNLPGVVVDLPAVTQKDMNDIAFGVEMGVDVIAASFIRKREDVEAIRALPGVAEAGIKIISKIESQEGLDNFNAILEVTDAVMVARGDLGVEIPIEKVASAQKMMIAKCNAVGKPVITATQMLDSMIVNPRPTRAEATDVANAVFDGTDCVMLSGETAKGKYPVETISVMSRICGQAQADIDYRELYKGLRARVVPPIQINHSIASSAVKTAWDLQVRLVLVLTETGNTAGLVSRYRPGVPILAVTSDETVARQLLLNRGVIPFVVRSMEGTAAIINDAIAYATRQLKLVRRGDLVVLTSGVIEHQTGSTNSLRVITVQ